MTATRGSVLRGVGIFLGLLALSVLRCGDVTGYSVFQIDEEVVVGHALQFLGGDLNPHWFNYHSLPMYLLGSVYAVMYAGMHLVGAVDTLDEFVGMLFWRDALFYVTGKVLMSFLYTSGCAALAWVIWRRWHAPLAALALFAVTFLLPDALVASSQIKVEAVVFLCMAGLLWFGFLAPRSGAHVLVAAVLLAAAVDSKIPALTLTPVVAAQVGVDLWNRRYSWRWAAGAAALFCVAVFVFMPYAFLDPDAYRGTVERTVQRASGDLHHFGKVESAALVTRAGRVAEELARGSGVLPLALCVALAGLAAWRRRELLLALALPAAYATAFVTSRTLDAYWLRPVFPFVAFFCTVLLLEVAELPSVKSKLREWGDARKLNPAMPAGAAVAVLVLLLFCIPFGGNLPQVFAALRDHPEDTRVVAARWIRENIPPGSGIVLDGSIPHYHPVIPATDPKEFLENMGYPSALAARPPFRTAYRNYYMQHVAPGPTWRVASLAAERADFDPDRVNIRPGVYVVLTDLFYKRFFLPHTERAYPEVSRMAGRYYGYIRSQEPVMAFSGRGPKIEIWRMTGARPSQTERSAPPG